jgi:hypothetical protein
LTLIYLQSGIFGLTFYLAVTNMHVFLIQAFYVKLINKAKKFKSDTF